MAYQRTEYHREEDRDNKTGGWRSWLGLDNKDRDEEHRPYNYQSTTTYRNPQVPSYERSTYPERPYVRGGYGYTTSDEVSRGPWTANRDYTTRPSYGQPTGDRDVYYREETRTYGGDREWTRPTPTSYVPSRSYGFSGEYPPTFPTTTTSRDYPTCRDYPSTTYPSTTYPSTTYPPTTYPPTTYPPTRDYPSSRDYPTSRDYPSTSYPPTYPSRYTSEYPTPSRGYPSEYPTPSRGYPSYDRDYTTPSRGYGYSRDYTGDSSYTRPSYQPTSYRY